MSAALVDDLHDCVAVLLVVENNGLNNASDFRGVAGGITHVQERRDIVAPEYWPFTSLDLCRIFAAPWQFYPFC